MKVRTPITETEPTTNRGQQICGVMRLLGSPRLTSPGSAPVRPYRTRFLAERALQGGTAAMAGVKRLQNADCRLQISDCPSTPVLSSGRNLQSAI